MRNRMGKRGGGIREQAEGREPAGGHATAAQGRAGHHIVEHTP